MFTRLNDRQHEAVKYISGPMLVLAGAGSGKTSVITTKIAYLIADCGLKARNILAVTFTNKAAREMKERVGRLLRAEQSRGLTVSTFHSLGMKIIRKEHQALGLNRNFSIFDQQDARALVAELMHKQLSDGEDCVDAVVHRISCWKNNLFSPAEALSQSHTQEDSLAARVYAHYARTLKAFNAVDFDDLIFLPVKLFEEQRDVLERWQARVHYLLVDEYQDTNASQYLLVKMLAGSRAMLTVVGDDDQSIYAWRGAKPENMALLKDDFPGLKLVKLEQNYRSTSRILKAANTLIANNPHAFEKRLWSDLGEGDEIRVIRCRDEQSEALRVATEILAHRLRHDHRWGSYAILYRGNFQSRMLEMQLQEHQIPYRLSGGTSFFSRAEIKDMMAYLRLLVNPDDDTAFLRIVNVPRREIGPSTLEKLSTYVRGRQVSLFQACDEIGLAQVLDRRCIERLTGFTRWLSTLARIGASEPMKAIHMLVAESEYESWLYQHCSSHAVAERRMGNIAFLVQGVANMFEKSASAGEEELTLEEAIGRLVLRDLMERQEEDTDTDRVQMLTLHASKGLEYPHVFMVGMEEELLPHRTSIEEDSIDEERRLTYVGITRARERLVMTLAGSRRQFGETVETTPSRFLDELPQEDLVYEGWQERTTVEQIQARGQEALDDIMRGLLDQASEQE